LLTFTVSGATSAGGGQASSVDPVVADGAALAGVAAWLELDSAASKSATGRTPKPESRSRRLPALGWRRKWAGLARCRNLLTSSLSAPHMTFLTRPKGNEHPWRECYVSFWPLRGHLPDSRAHAARAVVLCAWWWGRSTSPTTPLSGAGHPRSASNLSSGRRHRCPPGDQHGAPAQPPSRGRVPCTFSGRYSGGVRRIPRHHRCTHGAYTSGHV
jgi:hypothetical protein